MAWQKMMEIMSSDQSDDVL